ncbi:MAG: anhydro-N-acetylmuramic acid kinase, partial [Chitinophagaceae bacterium]
KFGNATLQIGDGDHLAVHTGIITISDFRQKHIAAGGEGAPLAVYGDYLIFSRAGEDRIMLNMGGIANFTYLPGNLNAEEVFCTDTGPGNTLMDAWIQEHVPGAYFDKDGALAASGEIHTGLLAALKANSFFDQPFPKTTGPELFNLAYLSAAREKSNTQGLSVADVMATLNRFSAETIAESVNKLISLNKHAVLYASGGGMHNSVLMQHLQTLLPHASFQKTESLGVHPDAKEAVLFAVLANECIAGGKVSYGNRQGVPSVTMGKISFPW